MVFRSKPVTLATALWLVTSRGNLLQMEEVPSGLGFARVRTSLSPFRPGPSVFDMIRVLGGQKAPYKFWDRITKTHPELWTKCQKFKFPGRGQGFAPVAKTKEGACCILGKLGWH